MMKSPKTRASKAVLKARAARDLAAIDGDQAVFRIEEAQRRRMVAEAREQYEELIEVVDDEEFDRALSLRTPEKKLRQMSTYQGPRIDDYQGHQYGGSSYTKQIMMTITTTGTFLTLVRRRICSSWTRSFSREKTR